MATELQTATTSRTFPTTPFSEPWLMQLRRALGNVNGRPALMTGFSINREQHRQILHHKSRLQQAVRPGVDDHAHLLVELGKLVAAFPMQAQSDVPSALRVEAYVDALNGAPSWAVHEARLRIIRGATSLDQRFPPTPPQLATLVEEIMRSMRRDLADLIALADAVPLAVATDNERERVKAGFEKLVVELGGKPVGGDPLVPIKARKNLEKICDDLGIDRARIDLLPDAPPRAV